MKLDDPLYKREKLIIQLIIIVKNVSDLSFLVQDRISIMDNLQKCSSAPVVKFKNHIVQKRSSYTQYFL